MLPVGDSPMGALIPHSNPLTLLHRMIPSRCKARTLELYYVQQSVQLAKGLDVRDERQLDYYELIIISLKNMQSNRTRNAQKKMVDFMVNAGCNPENIREEYPNEFVEHKDYFKKAIDKKAPDSPQGKDCPDYRHKKIHKPPKRVEKYRVKPARADSTAANTSIQPLESTSVQVKNISANQVVPPPNPEPQISPVSPMEQQSASQSQFSFPLCVNKADNVFYGYFGHSTIFLTKPVVQGNYYIEIQILNPTQPSHPKGKKFPSYVRVGVCKDNYRLLVPLGGQDSYAYKSRDGDIIHQNKHIHCQVRTQYGPGDTVGISLNMEPPFRPVKNNSTCVTTNQGSELVFFKNGNPVGRVQNLKQYFYHFGVSLFNWANVRINMGPQFKHPLAEEQIPALTLLEQNPKYPDIKC